MKNKPVWVRKGTEVGRRKKGKEGGRKRRGTEGADREIERWRD